MGYGTLQGDCKTGGKQNTTFVRVKLYDPTKGTSVTPKGKGKGKGAGPPGGDMYWLEVPHGMDDLTDDYPCVFPQPSEC